MQKTVYTAIPDTTDTNYWEAKPYDSNTRCRAFVPRNKELHRKLKQKKREEIDKRLGPVKRHFEYRRSPTGTLPKAV